MSINKLYKLSSGETIISHDIIDQINSESNQNNIVFITLKSPLALMMQPNEKGGIQYGVIPWMSGDVCVKPSMIIAYSEAPDELDKEYIRMTSNIQLAH